MSDELTHALKATLKAGPGYEAPWITVEADNPTELAAKLDSLADAAAPSLVNASNALQAVYQAARALKAEVTSVEKTDEAPIMREEDVRPRPERTQANAPGGKFCQHGAMVNRNGTTNGRGWSGWFCPLPKGDPNQCKPVFG